MLTVSIEQLQKKAMHLYKMLENIDNNKLEVEILNRSSKAGGGSLPLLELPSRCIGIKIEGVSPNFIEKQMRNSEPPIIGRIEDNIYLMDLRTIQEDEFSYIENALKNIYG
ncbi:MAG: hypothetical protein B6I31_04515 [Desulfobacteraceae bacterium 4572_19]|nr:MAG: hypothetical protein B6I31_04515 [Desulfobacteraceae bacterium 4572_19]